MGELDFATWELLDLTLLHHQRELQARGHIYKSSYAGWYAVSDEAYYSETQVTEVVDATGAKQMVSRLTLQIRKENHKD